MSEAPNSRTGLAVAEVLRPDLILMDVMMEERTEGFFALQQLRRSPALMHIPVFVVSSIYSSIPGFGIGNTAENILADIKCSLLALKPNEHVDGLTEAKLPTQSS